MGTTRGTTKGTTSALFIVISKVNKLFKITVNPYKQRGKITI
jgi:hypothetical protein